MKTVSGCLTTTLVGVLAACTGLVPVNGAASEVKPDVKESGNTIQSLLDADFEIIDIGENYIYLQRDNMLFRCHIVMGETGCYRFG